VRHSDQRNRRQAAGAANHGGSEAKRIAILWNPNMSTARVALEDLESAARPLNLELIPAAVRGPEDFDSVLQDAGKTSSCSDHGATFARMGHLNDESQVPSDGNE
jgi:ABC-type uncharacterized transport system substrate-binding protein